MLTKNDFFVEVGSFQKSKEGMGSPGDVFYSSRTEDGQRTICILADGLGSGIKANVLATLTSTMAMNYIKSDIDLKRASEIIMATLPVCSVRKVGYSTFTIVDVSYEGRVRIIEYDNPCCLLLRNGRKIELERSSHRIDAGSAGQRELKYTSFDAVKGDKLFFCSDGVTQSGMGTDSMPLGWTSQGAEEYITAQLGGLESVSARKLARRIVERALKNDGNKAKDDISAAVISFRHPRRTLVITGPPYNQSNDGLLASKFEEFSGRKLVCGGTTARIIANQTKRDVKIDLSWTDPYIPPASKMEGAELVTEGTVTLSRALELLKSRGEIDPPAKNPAEKLVEYLLESDSIHFIVGTKINEAHQDPNLPASLDIRRNMLREIVDTLNNKHLKSSDMELI
ncbi:stage II sporulation protein E [Sedimentisphaera cyanobacteriorum]|uniref:Stage II sporulation protein E n=1 Tax=Sedimentisphaera cyanobacteriorum TaxID=1940790 RepID=A0A1Q2HQ83_9BACT|nr:SpoIIE family protein phosphatase [Sedimentisphaera cyanobacteriorum]AQQ09481.1 stage II sporulation protein E [Sedimentisphaera cyanobacteriorum]